MDEIFDFIKEQLHGLTSKEVTMDSTFHDLELDSLDLVDVVVECEDRFNIHFEDDDIESLKTVGDVINLISEKMKAA